MKKIFFLLIGFFLFGHLFYNVTFAQMACDVNIDPQKTTYSSTENIYIQTSGDLIGDTGDGSNNHRILVFNNANKQIKSFCDTADSLTSQDLLLGTFSQDTYTVKIMDRCSSLTNGNTVCQTSFTTKTAAVTTSKNDNVTLKVDNPNPGYGSPVKVFLDSIPATARLYNVEIRGSSQARGGTAIIGNLAVKIEPDGSGAFKCSVKTTTVFSTFILNDPWGSYTPPVCEGNGPFRVTATVDTKQIGIDANDTKGNTFTLDLTSDPNVGSHFTVGAPKASAATFTIDEITPNPAKPGDTLAIKLGNAVSGETYTYFIGGSTSTKQTQKCNAEACTLSLILSGAITNDALDVVVQDNKGNQISKQLAITLANPILTGIQDTPTIQPTVPLPCEQLKTDSSGGCAMVKTAIGGIPTDPEKLLTYIFGLLLSLSGGIALLLIIFSGYQIMTSEGNPEKIQGARDTITSAVIGLVFMIFSLILLQIIGVQILHIPGFS